MFGWTARERTGVLAAAGITGAVEFVLAILALHVLGGIPQHMSEFANGRYPWLWAAGAFGLALGGICLTLAIQPYLPTRTLGARIAWGLLWLSGAGALVVASFPVDREGITPVGFIHNTGAVSTFTTLSLCMLLLGTILPGAMFRGFGRASRWIGGVLLFLAGCYILIDVQGWGANALVQRALVASVILWFVILAMTLLNAAAAPAPKDVKAADMAPAAPVPVEPAAPAR